MKNFKLLFSVAVASALFGCSSMEVEEQEALLGNLPADFSYQEYMELHPELRNLQIKDYVTAHNSSAAVTAEQKAADENAFWANAAQLHDIYVDPYMGGHTEAEWAAAAGDTALIKKEVKDYNLVDTTGDYQFILANSLDTFAISYQYKLFGQLHYWAYRRCTETEALKPNPIFNDNVKDANWVAATKHYCVVAGDTTRKEID